MTAVENIPRTSAALIQLLQRNRDEPCGACGKPLALQGRLMAIAIGFNNAPRCLDCLSVVLQRNREELRDALFTYIQRRDCFKEAWDWTCRQSSLPEEFKLLTVTSSGQDDKAAPATMDASNNEDADGSWDAGDQGCGELALELRLRLEKLAPGQIFELTARDLGVPEDLPAWCRLTGHTLLRADPPRYRIRRKK